MFSRRKEQFTLKIPLLLSPYLDKNQFKPPEMMEKRRKIRVADLNPHLTCNLCKGYLVNPVTITECIHTFCKSCLIRHVSLVNRCPTCNTLIHETQPLYNIRLDRTMQDIINKIFPRIEQDEQKREKKFYKMKGLPYPQPKSRASSPSIMKEPKAKLKRVKKHTEVKTVKPTYNKSSAVRRLHHSLEQISVQLEHCSERQEPVEPVEPSTCSGLEVLPKKFIRCSTHVTIGLLQRFIATKLKLESETMIGISHNETEMDRDFTLKYISDNLLQEKDRLYPLMLQYKSMEVT